MFGNPDATGGHEHNSRGNGSSGLRADTPRGSPEAPRPARWALTPETHGTRDREAQATSAPSAHAEPPGHQGPSPARQLEVGGGGGEDHSAPFPSETSPKAQAPG